MSVGHPTRRAPTHIVSHEFIGEPLGPRPQVSFDFCVERLSDILRVQHIPPAERDTEFNAPREAPQRDRGRECEYHTGYLPSVMRFISADFERVAFDVDRTGRAGADLNGTTREKLIIGE
jgi:hypothetical protein